MSPLDLFSMLWMLILRRPSACEMRPSMSGTFAFAIARRYGASRGIDASGKFTAFCRLPFSRYSRSWSTTMTAELSSASPVEAPRCGSATTLGFPRSAGLGKSVTYHSRRPLSSPFATASSDTTPSREKLSSTAPSLKFERFFAFTRCRVFSTSGTCRLTKWLVLKISSIEAARFTCEGRLHAASTVICGSNPSTFIPSLIAASATRLPIFPRPMTPSVWPGSSLPANCFFPSSIFFSRSEEFFWEATKARAGARLRAAMSMPASTSSFTALAFAPGALNTGMPRLLSAATGMLLTPAPARPTAFSEGPNSNLCRSWERTSTANGSFDSLTTA